MSDTTHHPPVDRPRAVRDDDRLDLEALRAHLDRACPALSGPLALLQFPGGHSNLTYLLRIGDREVVLRRPPRGAAIATAHDMGREHRILSGLTRVYDKAPRPLHRCDDPSIIGAPFYLMERLEGVILRGPAPRGFDPTPEVMRRVAEACVDDLVALHSVDLDACGLASEGKPEGYIARQVSGWTRRYQRARTDDLPQLERAAAWLAESMPPERPAALIHNDYKLDNLVLDPADLTRVVGVLDWEMATVADPMMDLGTSLAYWVQPDDPAFLQMFAFGPTSRPGCLTRLEVAERYASLTHHSLDHLLFYYVYGLFKLAVIGQQIYARFKQGHASDPRFAALIHAVRAIGEVADRAISRQRVDRLGD